MALRADATQCIECPEGRYSAGVQQCIPCGGNEEWLEGIGECRRRGKEISIEEAVRIFRGQSVGLQLIELVVGALSVVSTLCLCYIWCSRPTHRGAHTELAGVLRESFIGQDNLPARQLTALDVPARWVKAAAAANQVASGWSHASPSSSSGLSSLQRTASTESGLSRRLAKHSDNAIHVMFTSEHVCEKRRRIQKEQRSCLRRRLPGVIRVFMLWQPWPQPWPLAVPRPCLLLHRSSRRSPSCLAPRWSFFLARWCRTSPR